jgi:hypothetical protein
MLVISLATASTVLTLKVFSKGDEEVQVTAFIQRIFFDIIAQVSEKSNEVTFKQKNLIHSSDNSKHKNLITKKKKKIENNHVNNAESRLFVKEDDLSTKSNKLILRASPIIDARKPNEQLLLDKINPKEFHEQLGPKRINRTIYTRANSSSRSFENADDNENFPDLIVRQNNKNDKDFLIVNSNRLISNIKSKSNANSDAINLTLRPSDLFNLKRNSSASSSSQMHTTPEKSNVEINLNKRDKIDIQSSTERKKLMRLLKIVSENIEKAELRSKNADYLKEIRNQWTQLAKVIDILLAYSFFILTFLLYAYIVNQAPNAKLGF